MKLNLSSLLTRWRRAGVRRPHTGRRAWLAGSLLLAGGLALQPFTVPVHAQTFDWGSERWVGTWGAGPGGPPAPANTPTFSNQTLRLIVHTSIGGNRVRIRLSNELGATPLHIGAAHIALRAGGADIRAGSDRVLTFGGQTSVTVPPFAPALSDPVDLDVPALSDLAVSLYLPDSAAATTIHGTASQTNYVSLPGDFTGAPTLPMGTTGNTTLSWPWLTQVDVTSGGAAIVTLGNSITDGTRSTPDTNNRWPDWLARRLQTVRDPGQGLNARLGVVNRGISGNRLLSEPPAGSTAGNNALARFDRDVLATAGVRYMTLMLGINDIGNSSTANPVTAQDLIGGYRQLIARAHEKGIAVFGATLRPFEGAGYYSPDKELVRAAVNNWIRSSDEFDGVIDFDRVIRDPMNPARMLPAYDSGDHLHPNDLGYQAMGNSVPLDLFRSVGGAYSKPAETNAR